MGLAMARSTVPRSEIFVLQKTGVSFATKAQKKPSAPKKQTRTHPPLTQQNWNPMGYNVWKNAPRAPPTRAVRQPLTPNPPASPPANPTQDTLSQFDFLLHQMQLTYVDITLNHWPTSPATPTVDPACAFSDAKVRPFFILDPLPKSNPPHHPPSNRRPREKGHVRRQAVPAEHLEGARGDLAVGSLQGDRRGQLRD